MLRRDKVLCNHIPTRVPVGMWHSLLREWALRLHAFPCWRRGLVSAPVAVLQIAGEEDGAGDGEDEEHHKGPNPELASGLI